MDMKGFCIRNGAVWNVISGHLPSLEATANTVPYPYILLDGNQQHQYMIYGFFSDGANQYQHQRRPCEH